MKQPKKAKPTLFLTPPTENPVPKSKIFFFQCKLEDFKSFEGSHSSLAYSSGEYRGLSRSTVAVSDRLMHFLVLGVKWGFWAINLVPDMLEDQGAKILAHWIGVQGPSKLVKKHPHFPSPSRANPSPKSKIFFNRTKKTCCIRRGFEQLSSYSGWRVITKKARANLLARAVVKRLNNTIS